MSDPLKEFLKQTGLGRTTYPPNSRYHGAETRERERTDGSADAYLARRFVPEPRAMDALREHVVEEGERLDTLAAAHFGDPLLFWRICDANGAIRPDELTEELGRPLRITLPEGVPGSTEEA